MGVAEGEEAEVEGWEGWKSPRVEHAGALLPVDSLVLCRDRLPVHLYSPCLLDLPFHGNCQ